MPSHTDSTPGTGASPGEPGRPQTAEIILPPGFRTRELLDAVCSKKAMEDVFDPKIKVMQLEWTEAMLEDRRTRAKWIAVRGHGAIVTAAVTRLPVSFVRILQSAWSAGA